MYSVYAIAQKLTLECNLEELKPLFTMVVLEIKLRLAAKCLYLLTHFIGLGSFLVFSQALSRCWSKLSSYTRVRTNYTLNSITGT